MKKLAVVGMLAAVLAGCTPGEAEFTLKTSEVRKALNGEVAHIRVHERMTTVLSNACRKVTFGDGKFTNQLDVVRALTEKSKGFDLEKLAGSNNTAKVWIEEKPGTLPSVKMDAQFDIALGTQAALERRLAARDTRELSVLAIDAETGTIGEPKFARDDQVWNAGVAVCAAASIARMDLLERLLGTEQGEELSAVDRSLLSATLPTWFKNLSCVVVGDGDEPLYVVAEDAKVNGKPMAKFEGYVKKGETVRFELNKEKHSKHGGMRFFLEKPSER